MAIRRIIYAKVNVSTFMLYQANSLRFNAGDLKVPVGCTVLLFLDFVQQLGTTESPYAVVADDIKTLMIKEQDDFNGDPLASATTAQWNIAGDRSDLNIGAGRCSVRLSTNTAAAIAAVGDISESIPVLLQIDMQTPGEDATMLLQLNDGEVLLLNDGIRGNEGDPVDPVPEHATQDYVIQSLAARFHVDEAGDIWLKDKAGVPVMKVAS